MAFRRAWTKEGFFLEEGFLPVPLRRWTAMRESERTVTKEGELRAKRP